MSSAVKRYHVIISERAGEMLVQHTRFLAQVSTRAADKMRRDVVETAKSLQEFPERGSWLADPLLPANKYRKLLVDKKYLLIYQIRENTVYIDYIVDCRQNYLWLI
ncbi:MAG: type II toxin-antitoxin system RelE/ParE family toxin [Desulfobacteraceae bacterium]|jgi:plasmid stabilization system protein ParE|nr:MAG: type II toxin-antitoxin system RelE/ParE family toxin [Desulfobacteraceae bacterium]